MCIRDRAYIESRTNQLYKEFLDIWPSFNEKMMDLETDRERVMADSETDPELEKYSEEELADPIKLIFAVREENGETK